MLRNLQKCHITRKLSTTTVWFQKQDLDEIIPKNRIKPSSSYISKLSHAILQNRYSLKANNKLDSLLGRIDTDLVVRKYELWYGMQETSDSVYLWYQTKNIFRKSTFQPNYRQFMQIDRMKRDLGKVAIAVSPFFVLPFSLFYWFPTIITLGYLFPKFIMPAHYMRGKNSRRYYRILHQQRRKKFPVIINRLTEIRNTNFHSSKEISKPLDDVHYGRVPNVDDLFKLKPKIENSKELYLSKMKREDIQSFCRMLLEWRFWTPTFYAERKLLKRMETIAKMDELLRKDDLINNLTSGELREACFIRGNNGYEPHRSALANRFWLENWVKLSSEVKPEAVTANEAQASFMAITLCLWSVNFSNQTYDSQIASEIEIDKYSNSL